MIDPVPAASPADRIRSGRLMLGLSQADLARKLGVWKGTVCRWEAGHNLPSPLVRRKLSRILNIAPMDLL